MVILVYSKFKKHIPRDEVSLALPAEQSIPECFTPVHLVVDKFQYVYDGKLDAGLSNMYYESLGAAIRISVSFFCNDRSPFELKNVKQLTRDATPIVRRRLSACTNWYTDTSGRSMDIYTTTKLAYGGACRSSGQISTVFDRRRIPRPRPAFVAAENRTTSAHARCLAHTGRWICRS
jgi:hypothetical protein